MSRLLQAEGVHAGYGDVPVLRDLTLQVDEGEIVTLLGPNGAGKTTFLRVVTGLLSPSGGSVRFAGGQIAGSPPHQIVRRGIAMVPEGKQLWPQMTVWEHLLVPAASRRLSNDERERQRDFVFELFPVLRERRDSRAVTFSGGEQQMLAIARALMSRPQLLLLDEPSLGLAPRVVESVFKAIAQIRSEAASVLLVEQNVRQALKLADRAYLMDQGSIYREGPAAELANVASADLARM